MSSGISITSYLTTSSFATLFLFKTTLFFGVMELFFTAILFPLLEDFFYFNTFGIFFVFQFILLETTNFFMMVDFLGSRTWFFFLIETWKTSWVLSLRYILSLFLSLLLIYSSYSTGPSRMSVTSFSTSLWSFTQAELKNQESFYTRLILNRCKDSS